MPCKKPVFVITGAAGSGKTTVAKYLRDTYQMARVITHTTRDPRPGEVDGTDYYFETPATFNKRHLLEKVEYDGHLYGSSYEGLAAGWANHPADVIVLDTAGALTYHQALGDQAVVIFLTVSHPQTLANRIKARGDQLAAVKSRLTSDEYRRDQFLPDYLTGIAHVVVNDDWKQTTASLDTLVAQVAPAVVQSSRSTKA
jgi:guanylate kinase